MNKKSLKKLTVIGTRWLIGLIVVFSLIAVNYSLFTGVKPASAQSTGDLEKQLKEKQEEIKKVQAQLEDSQKQEKTLKTQLQVIDSQVKITLLKIDRKSVV